MILDDPFGGLDQDSRRILSSAIATLTVGQIPQILMFTTNMQEIAPGVTHLLLVNEQGCVSETHVPVIKKGFKNQFQAQEEPPKRQTAKPSNNPAMCEDALQLPMIFKWPQFSGDQTLIELNDISVSYGIVEVLHNLTWTVRQGERWAPHSSSFHA